MNYKELKIKVPQQKGSRSDANTKYQMFGDFAVCETSDGQFFIVDADIVKLICHRSWCKSAGYLCTRVGDELIRLHDYVMSIEFDAKPQGCVIDHINQDRGDNRRRNLRFVEQKENLRNMPLRHNNTSGATGVSATKDGRYRAYITVDGKQRSLGYYEKFDDAVSARRFAEDQLGFLTRPHAMRRDIAFICALERGDK